MRVAGEAADGAEALARLDVTPVDVVLMDVRMPRMDGVEATRRLLARAGASPRVVVLTTFDLDEYAFAALRARASGFLLKDAPAEDMLAAIRVVHAGDAVIAPSTTRLLLDHVAAGLFLSEGTVKTHVGRVLGKLGLRDHVQAVIWAYEHRLVRRATDIYPGRPGHVDIGAATVPIPARTRQAQKKRPGPATAGVPGGPG